MLYITLGINKTFQRRQPANIAFGAFTLLDGHQLEHLGCRKLSDEAQAFYLFEVR